MASAYVLVTRDSPALRTRILLRMFDSLTRMRNHRRMDVCVRRFDRSDNDTLSGVVLRRALVAHVLQRFDEAIELYTRCVTLTSGAVRRDSVYQNLVSLFNRGVLYRSVVYKRTNDIKWLEAAKNDIANAEERMTTNTLRARAADQRKALCDAMTRHSTTSAFETAPVPPAASTAVRPVVYAPAASAALAALGTQPFHHASMDEPLYVYDCWPLDSGSASADVTVTTDKSAALPTASLTSSSSLSDVKTTLKVASVVTVAPVTPNISMSASAMATSNTTATTMSADVPPILDAVTMSGSNTTPPADNDEDPFASDADSTGTRNNPTTATAVVTTCVAAAAAAATVSTSPPPLLVRPKQEPRASGLWHVSTGATPLPTTSIAAAPFAATTVTPLPGSTPRVSPPHANMLQSASPPPPVVPTLPPLPVVPTTPPPVVPTLPPLPVVPTTPPSSVSISGLSTWANHQVNAYVARFGRSFGPQLRWCLQHQVDGPMLQQILDMPEDQSTLLLTKQGLATRQEQTALLTLITAATIAASCT